MRKWDWNWKKLSIVIVNIYRAYFSSCHKILQKWKYWTIMIKNIIYISGFSIDPLQFNATPLKNPLILSIKNQTMGGTFTKKLFYDFVAECVHIVMGIMTFIYLEIGWMRRLDAVHTHTDSTEKIISEKCIGQGWV